MTSTKILTLISVLAFSSAQSFCKVEKELSTVQRSTEAAKGIAITTTLGLSSLFGYLAGAEAKNCALGFYRKTKKGSLTELFTEATWIAGFAIYLYGAYKLAPMAYNNFKKALTGIEISEQKEHKLEDSSSE